LRDVQQLGGAREAAGAAGHFEGFQRVERGHFAFQGRLGEARRGDGDFTSAMTQDLR
jgi:hypothetical protein